ncbi:MAG TPA: diphosphomevalonate decarboxylase [Anaerolineales bacterium]|nr:diphosphomevalonate decarboxylase [Anaerolineales bacterium]
MQTTFQSATAIAQPNLAFIKYWGNQDHTLRIPSNGSISMNLAGLETQTRVRFDAGLPGDSLTLDGHPASEPALARAKAMLDRVRDMAGIRDPAEITSGNNFPTGTGIASSASAFAALALAASFAAGLSLDEAELSRLARTGSGSACRSVPGGFVEWQVGSTHTDSFAFTIASPEYWTLVDCVAIVSTEHKPTGSTEGHALANSSPLQTARVADAPHRLDICRRAIRTRDFETLADIVELDSNMMHSVMMTSSPRLIYWQPGTLAVMEAVRRWRAEGIPACYTIDAGPNVHVLCEASALQKVEKGLEEIPGVLKVLSAGPGGPARLL